MPLKQECVLCLVDLFAFTMVKQFEVRFWTLQEQASDISEIDFFSPVVQKHKEVTT